MILPESTPAQPAPEHWPLPNADGCYARTGFIEMMPAPLSPLFATFGVRTLNHALLRLTKQLVGASSALRGGPVVTINDYAYMSDTFPSGYWLLLMVRAPVKLVRRLWRAETHWRDQARPHYADIVARWRGCDARGLTTSVLLSGVREVIEAAVDHYATLQFGILPAAYYSEAVFAHFYRRFIQEPGDPPALDFVRGFNSQPIRAEKSLYDLALGCREHPDLIAFLFETDAAYVLNCFESTVPPAGVDEAAWRSFTEHFQAHIEHFGHAIYSLDFAWPTLADNPRPVLEAVRLLAAEPNLPDPYTRQHRATQHREESTQRMAAYLTGLKKTWFRALVDLAQKYAPLREEGLADVSLGWPLVRSMLLEIGRRLVEAGRIEQVEDVFWLTEAEITTWEKHVKPARKVNGGQAAQTDNHPIVPVGVNLAGLVNSRKARWLAESQVMPPAVLPVGARWAGLDLNQRIARAAPVIPAEPLWQPFSAERVKTIDPTAKGTSNGKLAAGRSSAAAQTPQAAGEGSVLVGLGVTPGTISGPACVVCDPEDFHLMRPGYILVAPATTTAWTPLFALAAGVVTDAGGALSHSSVVAREYGIPAVLGAAAATRRIRHGQIITVDGATGRVILSD